METLACVPGVELWKVYGDTELRIAQGEWTVVSTGQSVVSKVGDVEWSLTPALACLKPSPKSFVFAMDAQSRLFYCVNLPSGVSEEEISVVEAILANFCQYRISDAYLERLAADVDKQQGIEKKSKTDKVVEGVGRATVAAVRGLQVSSEYLSKKIRQGGDMVIDKTKECEEPKPVSEATRKRVKHIKTLSKTVSTVAHAAIDVVAGITTQVAEMVVDQVNKKTKDSGKPEKESTKSVKRVGASVLVAAAEVWEAMEGAFILVAKTSATTTKDIVSHKYGEEMGNVTYDGMSAAGHVADSAYVARRLGPKAVLKSAAKKTAAGYISSDAGASGSSDTGNQVTSSGQQTSLYPAVMKPSPT